jgi:predicted RecA/RadA family phage recombinase
MNNYIQPGNVVSLTAPFDCSSGQGAQVAALFGVACSDVAMRAAGEFQLTGVFELTKNAAEAWPQGAPIFWNNTARHCTTEPTDNLLIGCALVEATNPSESGVVRLN